MYDACAYSKRLTENMQEYSYYMYDGKYKSDHQCRIELGIVGGNNVSIGRTFNLVDLESDLRGQTRMASKCPSQHYTPGCSKGRQDGDGTPCAPVTSASGRLTDLPACQMFSYPAVQMPDPNPLNPSCTYTTDGKIRYNN